VLLLIAWIAVVVLGALLLGMLAYLTLGAAQRLFREVSALEGDLRPVVEQVQRTAARAAQARAASGR
jgi:hypothetical protein